ncbi:hypothetical protein [Pseudomonas sp. H1_D04]
MSIDALVYTQIASILGYVGTVFGLYRLLVQQKESVIQQKDSVIQLLKESLADRDHRIDALKSQTPDALASALSDRIRMSVDEIARLKIDGGTHLQEIAQREEDLRALQERLGMIAELIRGSDLVCPQCGAPLVQREQHTNYIGLDNRDWGYVIEFRKYDCGLSVSDEKEISPCEHPK